MNHQGTERCVLVTGASSGIGEAIVTALLEQGFIVYAGARRVERMSHLADKGARVLVLDITDVDSIASVLAHPRGHCSALVRMQLWYASYSPRRASGMLSGSR